MHKYLFCDPHNGYEKTYQPFESGESLTQEKAEKLIREICPAAGRVGGCLEHLLEALDKRNVKFKAYKSIYHKSEENHLRCCHGDPSIDPLPECMYSWDVIEGISGNY